MSQIANKEVDLLASKSTELRDKYAKEDPGIWEGSPFEWITFRPSRQKGAIGEKLVSGYFSSKGFTVEASPDSEADRVIDGRRAEIKISMLWKDGKYVFQQLRKQNYDFAICLGISPSDAHCWVLPKEVILEKWKAGEIKPQHGGKGGSDTAWLTVDPEDVQPWLDDWGGSLSDAVGALSRIIAK